MIVRVLMTVITSSKKKGTVVTPAVRKIMWVKRKEQMEAMLIVMKIVTLDC